MRLLLVHGFAQTPASWDGVRRGLDERGVRDVVAVEIPRRETFTATAAALAVHGPGVWCGYSMGGRLVQRLVVEQPALAHAVVLVSTTAGLRTAAERTERVAADEALAARAESIGTARFLDEWLAQPLFAGVPTDAPGTDERRTIAPATLAHDLRTLGTGTMEPLWDRLAALTMPVTVVTGRRDDKFEAIGRALTAAIPGARHEHLDGGHALPAECPDALAAVLHATHSAAVRNAASTT